MTVFRTSNPQEYDLVDGVIIDEKAPSPSIRGVGTGVAILVGVFNKGPVNRLEEPGSLDGIVSMFGDENSGYEALVNKRFSRLKIINVDADTAATAATVKLAKSSTDVVTLTARNPGARGNDITVEVGTASDGSGQAITLRQGSTVEVFD